jgi:glycosyltransferase involved in cell wall biosynthesis
MPALPTLWFDITTSWHERRRRPNGTLRVERSYARQAREHFGPRLRFCRYSRATGRFLPVAADAVERLYAATPPSAPPRPRRERGRLRDAGRRLERGFRHAWRSLLPALMRLAARLGLGGAMVPFAGGDVLILVGETWARHDLALLARLKRRHGLRLVALCQDLIPIRFPHFFESRDFVDRFATYLDFLIAEADLLVANSEHTRRDLLWYAAQRGGIHGRIEVVIHGADLPAPAPLARPPLLSGIEPGGFALSVSTIQPRKNFTLLYRLWRRLREEGVAGLPLLVIVGARGWGSDALLREIDGDPLTRPFIRILDDAGDDELAWLYEHCCWTLYPSFYEGWGLPLAESLMYGKLCLASNAASLPEAGQGLAHHLDPNDIDAWHREIVTLLETPGLLGGIEERIRRERRVIDWRQSGAAFAAAIAAVAAAGPLSAP